MCNTLLADDPAIEIPNDNKTFSCSDFCPRQMDVDACLLWSTLSQLTSLPKEADFHDKSCRS
jgi:hypothetical protein